MYIELNKSNKERVFQAVLFEVLANIIITFGITVIIQVSLKNSALLSCISAITATIWNYGYNHMFDLLQRSFQFERTFIVRIINASMFEAGLIIILTPIVMLLLSLDIYKSIMIEIGLVGFFLPYTLIYNWAYDYIRWKVKSR